MIFFFKNKFRHKSCYCLKSDFLVSNYVCFPDELLMEVDSGPQAVSNEWWAEYVKEEDQNKMELGGKLVLLFDILRMCEEIGDKV